MAIVSIKNKTKSGSLLVGNTAYLPIEYLVIAGGGGGSRGYASGYGGSGGAGGYRSSVIGESSGGGASAEGVFLPVIGISYTVTVGSGGNGVASNLDNTLGTSGNNSVFDTITSTGGGRGGATTSTAGNAAATGGSGGGGCIYQNAGAAGTANQGYAGQTYSGGGSSGTGGGAGNTGANGGTGLASSITGSSVTRAAGGYGSSGNGGANTGTGGGGGYSSVAAGSGGSGVVIIRGPRAAASTTGSPTYTTSGSYHIYTFTGSGSITY